MRILLVEDEPDAAAMLAKGLRGESYAVDIATDRYPLRKRTLYLDDLLEEVARAGMVLGADKNASVEFKNAGEAGFHGDEDLLRQMLLNLVDNAVRFTPVNGAVTLSIERRNDNYLLSVTDTGPGIPAEARQHIFERFFSRRYRHEHYRPRRYHHGRRVFLRGGFAVEVERRRSRRARPF